MGRILSRDVEIQRKRLLREVGTIRKDWGGRLPIALCYPNSYAVGMCNLGFQSVYNLFNSARGFVCERVFAEPVLIGSRTAGRADWTGDDKYRISRQRAIGHLKPLVRPCGGCLECWPAAANQKRPVLRLA